MSDLFMSSRRTIQSGEVVTFATSFRPATGPFHGYDDTGPFEVSASRDAVIVHRADLRSERTAHLLIQAVIAATAAMRNLEDTWRGGAESKYPSAPTIVPEAMRLPHV